VAEFINKNHKADAIVDCTHLRTDVDFEKLTEEEQEKMLFLSSEARFIFYKTLAQKVSMPEIRIVCAISMDGCHGYSPKEQIVADPFYSALSGLYKGLGKEWGKSTVRIVDLGPDKGRILEMRIYRYLRRNLRINAMIMKLDTMTEKGCNKA